MRPNFTVYAFLFSLSTLFVSNSIFANVDCVEKEDPFKDKNNFLKGQYIGSATKFRPVKKLNADQVKQYGLPKKGAYYANFKDFDGFYIAKIPKNSAESMFLQMRNYNPIATITNVIPSLEIRAAHIQLRVSLNKKVELYRICCNSDRARKIEEREIRELALSLNGTTLDLIEKLRLMEVTSFIGASTAVFGLFSQAEKLKYAKEQRDDVKKNTNESKIYQWKINFRKPQVTEFLNLYLTMSQNYSYKQLFSVFENNCGTVTYGLLMTYLKKEAPTKCQKQKLSRNMQEIPDWILKEKILDMKNKMPEALNDPTLLSEIERIPSKNKSQGNLH